MVRKSAQKRQPYECEDRAPVTFGLFLAIARNRASLRYGNGHGMFRTPNFLRACFVTRCQSHQAPGISLWVVLLRVQRDYFKRFTESHGGRVCYGYEMLPWVA
jgi:hypothetical protein